MRRRRGRLRSGVGRRCVRSPFGTGFLVCHIGVPPRSLRSPGLGVTGALVLGSNLTPPSGRCAKHPYRAALRRITTQPVGSAAGARSTRRSDDFRSLSVRLAGAEPAGDAVRRCRTPTRQPMRTMPTMPLQGEYEPSTADWARRHAERYEATNGAEAAETSAAGRSSCSPRSVRRSASCARPP